MDIRKIIRYLFFEYDIKKFVQYLMLHPGELLYKDYSSPEMPLYLQKYKVRENENVKIEEVTYQESIFPFTLPGNAEQISDKDKWKIHLAGTDIFNFDPKNIEWERQFTDPEDMAAYHRFIWLYQKAVKEITEGKNREQMHALVKDVICSWLKTYRNRRPETLHPEIWHTYTVTERTVNWLYALIITGDGSFREKDIITALQKQLYYIATHLEYRGERFTGNHLSNNGKGLYIGGILLKAEEYTVLGRNILIEEAKRIIVNECFLREGSVHYQFLITKNYTDVYWIAKNNGDLDFAQKIEMILRKLVKGCAFFLYKNEKKEWDIPRIGDVSPDYPPEWLIGVPWAAKYLMDGNTYEDIPPAFGYHTFFVGNILKELQKGNIIQLETGGIKSDDWLRKENGNYKLFAHVNHTLYPNNLAGHFHHDTGGFVLLYHNEMVFLDCGRFSYEPNLCGNRGKGGGGHNLLLIDGKEPEMVMRPFYTDTFLKRYAGKAPELLHLSEDTVLIKNYAYQRFKGVENLSRQIWLKGRQVVIEDKATGGGSHEIALLFHTAYKVEIMGNNKFQIQTPHTTVDVSIGYKMDQMELIRGSLGSFYGHYSAAYGQDQCINTIRMKVKTKFPVTIKTRIDAKDK